MTIAQASIPLSLDGIQHIVVEDISWDSYELLARKRSLALPFLQMENFTKFVLRMKDPNQIRVLREFRDWVKSLPEK